MKENQKKLLIFLLTTASFSFVASLFYMHAKFLATAGLLLDIAGLVQLDISNFFDKLSQEYCDETKYPFGPPSYVTREIIDNSDTPIRTALRNYFFFESRKTGLYLLIAGCSLQLIAVWL